MLSSACPSLSSASSSSVSLSSSSAASPTVADVPDHSSSDLCRGCKRRLADEAVPDERTRKRVRRCGITLRSIDKADLLLKGYKQHDAREFRRWATNNAYPVTPFVAQVANTWVEFGRTKALPDRTSFWDPFALTLPGTAIISILRLLVYNMKVANRNCADVLRMTSGEVFATLCDSDPANSDLPPVAPRYELRSTTGFLDVARLEVSLDEWWLTTVMSGLLGTAEFSITLVEGDAGAVSSSQNARFQALLLDHKANPSSPVDDDEDAATVATDATLDYTDEVDEGTVAKPSAPHTRFVADEEAAERRRLQDAEDDAALDRLIVDSKSVPTQSLCLCCGGAPDATSSFCCCGFFSLHEQCKPNALPANFCSEPTCRALLCFRCASWGGHESHM